MLAFSFGNLGAVASLPQAGVTSTCPRASITSGHSGRLILAGPAVTLPMASKVEP